MSTNIISPWSGRRGARRFPHLAHEHTQLRDAVASLRLAFGSPALPPAGHAFFGVLDSTVRYLRTELPAHAAEEELTLYVELSRAVGPEEMGMLKVEHAALAVLASELADVVTRLLDGATEAQWQLARGVATRMWQAVDLHLTHEEAAIDRSLALGS